jgi:hypothetical protein
MGMRMPETYWAVFKRQVINLRNCCIWLVDSIESMMMHRLENPKSVKEFVMNNLKIFLSYKHRGTKLANTVESYDNIRRWKEFWTFVNTQYRNSYSLLSRTLNFRVNSTIILPFVLREPKLEFFLKTKVWGKCLDLREVPSLWHCVTSIL